MRETVYEKGGIDVFLRSQKKSGEVIDRGYDHPAAIAPVRLSHILSRVDARIEKKKMPERTPAIPTDQLFTVAEGLSKALEEADPNQQVVVQILRRQKRLVLFDHHYLTNFLAYVKGDFLFLHFSRIDWEVPKSRRSEKLPEPHTGKIVMDFRIHPSEAMTPADSQSVMVDWRNGIFKRPSAVRTLPGGRVVRRTILMQEAPEEEPEEDAEGAGAEGEADVEPRVEPEPGELSAETLRDLADLADERKAGKISESEYHVRRLEILRKDPASK
jgi:hypothetical protein